MVTNRNLGVLTDNFTSFGEFIFLAGLFQKTRKGGLKCQKGKNLTVMKYALEDYRRHQNEAEEQRLPGRAARPHHHAAQPPIEGSSHELLEHSSTAS
jgi:hypothetical protein